MDQHVTTTEVPYYTSAPTIIPTPSTSSNLIYTQDAQYHVPYPPQQQQQQQQQQQAPQQQDINYTATTAAPSYQIPTTNTRATERSTSTTQSSVDDDYVQNLANELQHTKQLLSQYQLRTEQLMSLVEKQTTKINELREQLADKKV
ncbi:hypothetical protein BDF21DRAFT_417214 [Thamnidium elegans]|nr:hypothetical protein BDF21DRAFT_417214 [Thamnidium elegans]